jgi:hypothetical protein
MFGRYTFVLSSRLDCHYGFQQFSFIVAPICLPVKGHRVMYAYLKICFIFCSVLFHSVTAFPFYFIFGMHGFGSIPGRCKVFLYFTAPRPALGPTQPLIQWVPGILSPGIKRPRREADHSLSSKAEVWNGGAIPPLPHMSS